jgi:hypothetical protein
MKRTITIEDNLQEIVDSTIDEVKDLLIEFCNENEPDDCPDINDLDESGRVHEIIDSSVPIYCGEIRDLWYLYKDDFEEAYEDAGIGDNPLDNDGMAAIYFYIESKVYAWYDEESKDIFTNWDEENFKRCEECDERIRENEERTILDGLTPLYYCDECYKDLTNE